MSPPRLVKVSPSRLSTWLDCPRAYRMLYLDRPRPARSPQRAIISVGNSTHAALSRFWELAPQDRVPAAVADVVRGCWQPSGFRDAAQATRWQGTVTQWVVGYLRSIDRTADPLAVERTVAMPTSTLALEGRVDRLDDRDGELVVVDYKTGRGGAEPGTARTSLALGLYALAVSRMWRRPCRRVELHHIPSATTDGHTHTDEALGRKLAQAESIAADVAAAAADFEAHGPGSTAFPPRPSALCRWCTVQAHCPEGLLIGSPQPSWAGLDALEQEGQSPAVAAPAP